MKTTPLCPLEGVASCQGVPEYHPTIEANRTGELHPGDILDDRFLITEVISRSGMAMIFKAQDLFNHNANVALKVPYLEYESDPGFFRSGRPIFDYRSHQPERHGDDFQGARPVQPQCQRRLESAVSGIRERSGLFHALSARGRDRPEAGSSLRTEIHFRARTKEPSLSGDRIPARLHAGAPVEGHQSVARERWAQDRQSALRGVPVPARLLCDPPRFETARRYGGLRWINPVAGLRAGQIQRISPGHLWPLDIRDGDARLYGTGTGPEQTWRCPDGHLQPGGDFVRNAYRHDAVQWR